MPALTADIAAASREAVIVTWANATIAARYPSARDGSAQPAEGYFDDEADAETVMSARGALVGVERQRYSAVAHDLVWPNLTAGLPRDRLIDADLNVDATLLVARLEVNLEAETTTHELFG